MSNLHTSNQARLEDYPPGVQCLLKDAEWHLEQLDLLKREFRAWQAAQDETGDTLTDQNCRCVPKHRGNPVPDTRESPDHTPRSLVSIITV